MSGIWISWLLSGTVAVCLPAWGYAVFHPSRCKARLRQSKVRHIPGADLEVTFFIS